MWDNYPHYLSDLLETIQLRAGKFWRSAQRRTRLLSWRLLWSLFLELLVILVMRCFTMNMTAQEPRRKKQDLVTMCNILNNLTPPYFTGVMPATIGRRQYLTGQSNNVANIYPQTTLLPLSLFPQTLSDCNDLEIDARMFHMQPSLNIG